MCKNAHLMPCKFGHFVLEREVKERTMVRPKVLFLQRLHAAEYIFETEGE